MMQAEIPETFYALRYVDGVPLDLRKHAQTQGRFSTYLAAVEALDTKPNRERLEVVSRTVPAELVVQR